MQNPDDPYPDNPIEYGVVIVRIIFETMWENWLTRILLLFWIVKAVIWFGSGLIAFVEELSQDSGGSGGSRKSSDGAGGDSGRGDDGWGGSCGGCGGGCGGGD
ncbi:hypothetical protein ACFYOY_44305 [Streptomyces sp. NPDC007875]|uniref:hypothetical protein n=1 Tax=Streptomyces sp. NPDC007875 TaxID=3364783 RepID=UPI0036991E54